MANPTMAMAAAPSRAVILDAALLAAPDGDEDEPLEPVAAAPLPPLVVLELPVEPVAAAPLAVRVASRSLTNR